MAGIPQELILHAWHRKNALFYLVLVPLSWLFGALVISRRWLYKRNILKSHALAAPVIVVGNIHLGGTGKTPVVVWLVEQLKAKGYKPGVISRGYGVKITAPIGVSASSQASNVGDEPLLIAKRCACPVFVSANRVAAGEALLKAYPDCNVVISDDGLQHYRLKRDVEIALLNSDALEGAWILPAGPLREPSRRLRQVDAIICNGEKTTDSAFEMQLLGTQFYNLLDPNLKVTAADFKHKSVKAMAGIGKPERFFEHLRNLGLSFAGVSFNDHHAYTAADLARLNCDVLLMTEKDAVKCQPYAQSHHWVLPVSANIDAGLLGIVLKKLQESR